MTSKTKSKKTSYELPILSAFFGACFEEAFFGSKIFMSQDLLLQLITVFFVLILSGICFLYCFISNSFQSKVAPGS